MAELHEECGIFGVYSEHEEDVASLSYYALYALQHRGQEGCGIALNDGGVITSHKDNGLVREVFASQNEFMATKSRMAIAHARYGTTGMESRINVQPLVITHMKGRMALAHNGNLTNDANLRQELELSGSIFHTTSDTEVIAYVITRNRLCCPSIEAAIEKTMDEIQGAYSLLVMSSTKLIAVRDPWGFRPLCLGKLHDGYVFASESCALDAVGAQFVRDVEPGEIIVIDSKTVKDTGPVSIKTHCNTQKHALCVFELIYFARPDSIIDTIEVHTARLRAGAFLALEHPAQADVVIGVPDSGLDAAIGYSRQSGI
ncbi:MAG: class II glutamine amidotransferase, partial [Sphaerochaeta sp.]|nr:class II glutamine amidotransferase [Sphaerochaeta sp.]